MELSMVALNDLLAQSKLEDNNHNNAGSEQKTIATASPASVIPSSAVKIVKPKPTTRSTDERKEGVNGGDIWEEHEVQTSEQLQLQAKDSRQRPEYDVLYKQRVGSEDLYLGIGEVTPSSASCEMIVLKIQLPGDKIGELDLDVKKQTVVLKSKIHYLATYLPHPVDHNGGEAKWDAEKCMLSVTLPLLE